MKTAISAAALCTLALVPRGEAAQLTLSAFIDAAYEWDAGYASKPFKFNSATHTFVPTENTLFEIPIYFQLSDLAPGQSFGNVSFNVSIEGDASADIASGPYYPSEAIFTVGKVPFGYYATNSDAGLSNTDLQSIVASFPPGMPFSQRASVGLNEPFLLGYIYVGTKRAYLSSSIEIYATQYSLNTNGVLAVDNGKMTAAFLHTEDIPEPAGLGVVVVGVFSGARRRFRA